MRYSIMLQLVTSIALILVASAALFGWLQSRPIPNENVMEDDILSHSLSRKHLLV